MVFFWQCGRHWTRGKIEVALLCMFRQVCHQTLNEAVVWCTQCLWHIVCIYYMPAIMKIVGKIEVWRYYYFSESSVLHSFL